MPSKDAKSKILINCVRTSHWEVVQQVLSVHKKYEMEFYFKKLWNEIAFDWASQIHFLFSFLAFLAVKIKKFDNSVVSSCLFWLFVAWHKKIIQIDGGDSL
jgi:hypothetical protein